MTTGYTGWREPLDLTEGEEDRLRDIVERGDAPLQVAARDVPEVNADTVFQRQQRLHGYGDTITLHVQGAYPLRSGETMEIESRWTFDDNGRFLDGEAHVTLEGEARSTTTTCEAGEGRPA